MSVVNRVLLWNIKTHVSSQNYIARSPATANVSPGRPKSVYMGQQNS